MIDEIYRVNEKGERVTWETCACHGCFLERAMREMLAIVDAKYTPSPDQQRYYTPLEQKWHITRWMTEREAIVQRFVRAGWFGCLAPMVIKERE